MRKKRRHRVRSFFFGLFALGCTAGFIVGGLFLLWASTLTLPTTDIIETQRKQQSTKIYDRTGTVVLYDMYQDIRRTVVSLENMSDDVKNATMAIEDSGFYSHFGVEPLAIVRAIVRNLQDGDLFGGQGGSTITQQVVKNTLLVSDKKISRKLKEWILAVKLEQKLTKDQILELYLNEVPYGGTKYGVEEASQGFFGVPASDLSLAQSAYIAALPQAPTYYSPYGNNRDALEKRKNKVLTRMYELGYITEDQLVEANKEVVEFRPFTSATIKAPHFVFYVIEQLQDMYRDIDISQANLQVTTTLDWELENEAERIINEKVLENVEKYNATNGSLMAVDPRNGQILVMVGSRDYFDDEIDGNFNIGLAKRQPGSSFKPFAYGAAIEKGYTTETVVYDVRTQFSTGCDKTNLTSEDECYSPGNYDHKFRGPMTFREALAQSVNVPAVKVMYLAGAKETFDFARRVGVQSLTEYQRYGLTLVLGGGEVSLLEMTSAYATFARDGYRYPYTAILEIKNHEGKELYKNPNKGEQVIDPGVAHSISDILADNIARTPAFGHNSFLHFPEYDVAVKTGTTNDYRDAWIIGYTPNIAVGAWAGNNDNSAMEKKVAGFIVAPMWNEFMTMYFEKYPDSPVFPDPPKIDRELKPVLRGVKPGPKPVTTQSSSTIDIEPIKTTPEHSILHWIDKDDPNGTIPSNPSAQDAQYGYWEYGILLWRIGQGTLSLDELTNKDIDELTNSDVDVTIREPDDGDDYKGRERVRVELRIKSDEDIVDIQYYIDGKLVGTQDSDKTDFKFTPNEFDLDKGEHTLMVIVYNEDTERGGATVDFEVR